MGLKRSRSDSLSSSESPDSPCTRETSVDVKIVHLDAETVVSQKPAVMKCELPPHAPLSFTSLDEYDVHYRKNHVNRCSACGKNFPDEHFLHLHIAECHDPFSAARRERGEKIYQCLLPDCERFCSTPQKRRLHCIDKHSFPKNFDFFIVKDGIDRRSSMLRQERRRSSTVGSVNGAGAHRRRSSTMASISQEQKAEASNGGDSMNTSNDVQEDDDEAEAGPQSPTSPQRAPLRLRGRGGFGRGRGRGRGRGGMSSSTAKGASGPAADPLDALTKDMSALKFVPHSVRVARGGGSGAS